MIQNFIEEGGHLLILIKLTYKGTISLLHLVIFYLYLISIFIYVYVPHLYAMVLSVPQEPEERILNAANRCLELKSGPLEEQREFFTNEPSLQTPFMEI